MADYFSSSDDDEEFLGFTVEEITEAEERNVRKQLEIANIDSDISISDISDSDSDIDSESEASSDDDQPLAEIARWSIHLRPINVKNFSGPNPGPLTLMDTTRKEIDFFHLLFTEDIYQTIAEQTNAYAERARILNPNRAWYPTNAEEIKAYLGAAIVMGVLPAPAQDMYWYKDKLFHPSCLEGKFSRTRFENIQRYFHVADTTTNPGRGNPGHDKLAHVRPIMEKLRENFLREYKPHREVSVDEAMIGYSGRLGFKQYVPLKPTKRGIKVWVRADPHNGYVNDFQVYTGRINNAPEKDLGSRVVLDLIRPIMNKGHHVYCDSFFTSPDLFLELLREDTYACGTVRANRKGLPKDIGQIKLKEQGKSITKQKGSMRVTVWRDKKNITILQTNSDGEATSVGRKQKDGNTTDVPCPESIKLYNQYMNGVDHADQLRSTYNTARKALKWWKYLFFFLFDVSVVNSYLLMRESTNHEIKTKGNKTRQRTQMEFRMQLAHQMLGGFTSKRKRQGEVQAPAEITQTHWPTIMPKKKTCKQCATKKIRSEPTSGCDKCNVNLCLKCFKPYHLEKFPELS
ncbi:piggyBac transposable element-derived protein 4-like [Saccostrea echinata]|uniref:piggyBac transposable element-derived protein 4-like n=1 Tax=Saccostrea echinata TaxID=191078 RepID=UPI002A7EEB4E|nr:piggyBac transposable element-derived protein 4-like [Saccostrea echinata]